MADYTKLQQQILEEAEQEATRIREKASERLEAERAESRKKAELEAEKIRTNAKKQVPLIEERVFAEVERKSRNAMLSAKQELVDRVFQDAEKRLLHLSDPEWQGAIKRYLQAHSLSEEAVLEIPEDREFSLPSGRVEKVSDLKSGFRVREGGVTENYDFPEVLRYLRRSLEQEVVRALTEGES